MISTSGRLSRIDWIKLLITLTALVTSLTVFVVTPAISTPFFLSVVISLLLSPLVASLERRGIDRNVAIILIFAFGGVFIGLSGYFVAVSIHKEWGSFVENAPVYFDQTIQRVTQIENRILEQWPFLKKTQVSETLISWGEGTGQWFVTNGPKIMGDLLTWLLIVPFLSYFFIKDGRRMSRSLFKLVPNSIFESTLIMTSKISASISDYIRAKTIEGILVGILTTIGMLIIDAPYAIVLGIIAGVTNIVPYVGPFIGAAPGIVIALFDPRFQEFLWPITIVYIVANAVDLIFIFPILVAKLVNLHPLVLIIAVIIGGQYYGLIGMLISIPIASSMKIIFQEIQEIVYPRYRTPYPAGID